MKLKNRKIETAEIRREIRNKILLLYRFERRKESEFENRKIATALIKVKILKPKIPKVNGSRNQKKWNITSFEKRENKIFSFSIGIAK